MDDKISKRVKMLSLSNKIDLKVRNEGLPKSEVSSEQSEKTKIEEKGIPAPSNSTAAPVATGLAGTIDDDLRNGVKEEEERISETEPPKKDLVSTTFNAVDIPSQFEASAPTTYPRASESAPSTVQRSLAIDTSATEGTTTSEALVGEEARQENTNTGEGAVSGGGNVSKRKNEDGKGGPEQKRRRYNDRMPLPVDDPQSIDDLADELETLDICKEVVEGAVKWKGDQSQRGPKAKRRRLSQRDKWNLLPTTLVLCINMLSSTYKAAAGIDGLHRWNKVQINQSPTLDKIVEMDVDELEAEKCITENEGECVPTKLNDAHDDEYYNYVDEGEDSAPSGSQDEHCGAASKRATMINNLQTLWSSGNDLSFLVGTVGPYNLSCLSFWSCSPDQKVEDQAADGYLKILETKCSSRVRQMHICIWTAVLWYGWIPTDLKQLLSNKTTFYGMIHEPDHWSAALVDTTTRVIIYANPLGENKSSQAKILRNWRCFAKYYGIRGKFSLVSPAHAKQIDNVSCGIYAMKFLREMLFQGTLSTADFDVDTERLEMSIDLLSMISIPASTCCTCRNTIEENELIQCKCRRPFHVKCATPLATFQEPFACILCKRGWQVLNARERTVIQKQSEGAAMSEIEVPMDID